jgi:hypothetical protein
MADVTIGALLALAGFCLWQAQWEQYHFSRLVHSALGLPPEQSDIVPHTEANALKIMEKVYAVMEGRSRQIADVGHPEAGALWSSDDHLSEPSGACASYTQVLAKALRTAGFPVRKVGLARNGQKGTHHVLETCIEGHWVLLDARLNTSFRHPNGHLAGAADLHADWPYYQKQTNADYDQTYDYSGYYYTNWDKVPIVNRLPSLQQWLESRGVSLRFLVLDVYQWFAGLSLAGAALLVGARLWPKARRRWQARGKRGGEERKHEVLRGAGSLKELMTEG